MGMSGWLLLLALLSWCVGIGAVIGTALREVETAIASESMPRRRARPGLRLIAHYAEGWLPVDWRAERMTRLVRAGMDPRWSPPEWFAMKCLGTGISGCAAALAAWHLVARFGPVPLLLMLPPVLCAAWRIPDMWLELHIRRRRRHIVLELTLHLEMLQAALEAGLTWREALRLSAEHAPAGPLRSTLASALVDSAAGCELGEVLRRLARRLDCPAASDAVAALLRAGSSTPGLCHGLQALIARRTRARLQYAERWARQARRRVLGAVVAGAAPGVIVAVAVPAVTPWLAIR